MIKHNFILLLFLTFNIGFAQNMVINEIMTSNGSSVMDDFGDYSDWVELYNNSAEAININQWSLSDNENELNKWQFPDTTIQPNDFILVFCSGKDTLSTYLHSSFKIDTSDEPIILSDEGENIIDEFLSINLNNNISFGRITDGGDEKKYFYVSSPGSSNNNNFELNEVSFSHDAGFYNTNFYLSVTPENPSGQVFYTINGNEPNPDSSDTFLYEELISIIEVQNNASIYAYIPTTPENNSYYFSWQLPAENIEKHVVIRARVFEGQQPLCNTSTNTYFVGSEIDNRFSLPVLSIAVDSISFFCHDTGIYIPGKRHVEGVIKSGNYNERGIEWERKGTIEYFDESGEQLYEKNLGLRIHGNITRAAPQKGIQFYPRNMYDGDDKMEYPFFEARPFESYRRIISRSIYSAHWESIVRDEIVQDIAKNLNVYYQQWQPVITFLNGEYWGVQVLREKQNEYYLKQHFDIDSDSVDIIDLWGVVEHGDSNDHSEFIYYTQYNDLSLPENYEVVKTLIDIPAYIDYNITEIFFGNDDWPGNNYTKWKEKGPNHKWRWFLFDFDASMKNVGRNNLLRATGDTIVPTSPEWSTWLFKSLLQNEEFSDQFISRFVYLLNNDFSPENTIPYVDMWESLLEDEMEQTIYRWGLLNNMYEWRVKINDIRQFLDLRPCILKTHLETYFEVENLEIPCDSSVPNNPSLPTVKVLPNPTTNILYVYTSKEIISWEIYNMSGSLIIQRNDCYSFFEQIDTSRLSNGLYTLRIYNKDGQQVTRIVKN